MSTNGIYQTHGVTALAENASATSTETSWGGGAGLLTVEGTGYGTVKLQVKSAHGTWLDVGSDTTFTANGVAGFMLPPSKGDGTGNIRISIASASAVYAYVIGY